MNAWVELSQVAKDFDGQVVFSDISLRAEPGESIVILGPSGAGKSVLLKIIAGLLEPSAGSVTRGTRDMGMLFQKNALFDSLTVLENLLFPLKERRGETGRKALEKSRAFLKAVGLESSEAQYPDEISGGMQKRLGIARALIVEPELILYDEPTAGLDPITSRTIADLIIKLNKERGCTAITVTSDVQRAYQLGQRIFLLAPGQWIEGGNPQQVKNTSDPALKQFIFGLREGPLTSGF